MITFFTVLSVSSDHLTCTASAAMDEGIAGTFYLPPLARPETSGITAGSRFLGILDESSGIGALLCGIGEADFNKSFKYNISVTGSISASDDVRVGRITLKNHVHGAGTLANEAGAVTGITGAAQRGVI